MPVPPLLELQCFGAPTARLDGHPAPPEVLRRKHLALLIYLALSPEYRRTRSHLLGLLWPEKHESYARHSLNQAVALLRAGLGAERLESQGETLALLDQGLEVDAARFDALADRQPAEAIPLFSGEFLEGFTLDDAPAFEEWAANARAQFHRRAAAAFAATGEAALAGLRYADAAALAQRAAALEPYSERPVHLLIQAAAFGGDSAAALAAYQQFSTRLAADVSEQPSRDLQALAERVRSMRWRRSVPIQTAEEPPLVGRAAVHREAFGLVESGLKAGPRVLLISGDPGSGRTRLLVESVDRLALAGAVVALARPLESDQDVPWSTLRALLRGGLLKAPGSTATDPRAYRLLMALEVATSDAGDVAAALASLLAAVAEEQPVGIGVDDANAADGLSLGAIAAAVGQLRKSRIVVALAAPDAWEQLPPQLVQLRGSVGRGVPGAAVRLEPLTEADTQLLVERLSPWCQSEVERQRLARRVFFEAGGNCFLTVTLLRGLEEASSLRQEVLQWPPAHDTIEAPLPISVPALAERAIMARLTRLEGDGARVLQAACIGSRAIDIDLVAALAGLPRPMVENQLALLERGRFVTFDGERYVVGTPLLSQVVQVQWLAPGERRLLQQRAVELLDARGDAAARLLRARLLAQMGRASSGVKKIPGFP